MRGLLDTIRKKIQNNGKGLSLLFLLTPTLWILWKYTDIKVPVLVPRSRPLTYTNSETVVTGPYGTTRNLIHDRKILKSRKVKPNTLDFRRNTSSEKEWEARKSFERIGLERKETNNKTISQSNSIAFGDNPLYRKSPEVAIGVEVLSLMRQENMKLFQKHETWKVNWDLMKLEPFNFLPNYKNPCWQIKDSSPLVACLPYFYLAGAPKAGTTDVYKRLHAHPEFAAPTSKEPHWLTRGRFASVSTSSIYHYVEHYFSKPTSVIYRSKNASDYHRKITGDCSASTMFDNSNWALLPHNASLQEPELTNADYIHHINPDARIIIMLREPVDRLYSDYLYFSKGMTQSDFHNAVTKVLIWFRDCRKTRTFRSCVYDKDAYKRYEPRARILIGIYYVYIAEFFRVFPRHQILIVKLEEYSVSPSRAMEKIFRFLGLSQTAHLDQSLLQDSSGHANTRFKEDRKLGQMWNKTKNILQDFYRPYNDILAKLLNDASFNYNDMYT